MTGACYRGPVVSFVQEAVAVASFGMRTQLIAMVLAVAAVGELPAQDHPAQIVAGSSINYPEVLRAAGIGGTVRVAVIILPGDTLAADGVRVVSVPHPGFRNAVLDGVRHWSYQAATHEGRLVADTLQVELVFEWGGAGSLSFGPMELRKLHQNGAGIWQAGVSPTIVRSHGMELKGARRDSAGIAAVRYLAHQMKTTPSGGAPIVCVTLHEERGAEPLTAADLGSLQTPGIAMVHPRRCPPIFSSMVYVVDRVIPPGSDPSRLVVLGAREYAEGWVVVRVEARYGNGKNGRDCILSSTSIGVVTECTLRESWVY